jgi:cell division control protein 7
MIEIKFYMRSLLQSVSQFHGLGLIHRDIKPANFLYNKELKKGVLIDYGLAEVDPNQ